MKTSENAMSVPTNSQIPAKTLPCVHTRWTHLSCVYTLTVCDIHRETIWIQLRSFPKSLNTFKLCGAHLCTYELAACQCQLHREVPEIVWSFINLISELLPSKLSATFITKSLLKSVGKVCRKVFLQIFVCSANGNTSMLKLSSTVTFSIPFSLLLKNGEGRIMAPWLHSKTTFDVTGIRAERTQNCDSTVVLVVMAVSLLQIQESCKKNETNFIKVSWKIQLRSEIFAKGHQRTRFQTWMEVFSND